MATYYVNSYNPLIAVRDRLALELRRKRDNERLARQINQYKSQLYGSGAYDNSDNLGDGTRLSQEPEDIQARHLYKEYQKAMEKTQKRAAQDRRRALGILTAAEKKALKEFAKLPPDVINEQIASAMYAGQRDIIEAQKAANLRNIQRSFYSGGSAPSGAMIAAASAAERAATGQMAEAKRQIDIERALKNWQSRFGIAKERAAIETRMAPEMADVLGNTIAAVPKIGSIAPELEKPKYKIETWGRLPGELNIDFKKRDPEGYKRWYAETYGQYKTKRVRI